MSLTIKKWYAKLTASKTVGIYGMIYPFVFLGLVFLSILLNSSWFKLTQNLLSDLGYFSKIGPIALFFNFTLIVCGFFLVLFSIGFISVLTLEFNGRSQIFTALGGGCLFWMGVMSIGVGIFTRDIEIIHAPLSFFFFACMVSSIGLVSLGMFFEEKWRVFAVPGMGVYMIFIALALIALFVYFLTGLGLNVALMQIFGGSSFYIWIFLHSYRIYKSPVSSLPITSF